MIVRSSRDISGLTLDPAYASFAEHDLGSLVIGKRADFVVLDRNIMTVAAEEILQTKVLATVLDGVVQFGRVKGWWPFPAVFFEG